MAQPQPAPGAPQAPPAPVKVDQGCTLTTLTNKLKGYFQVRTTKELEERVGYAKNQERIRFVCNAEDLVDTGKRCPLGQKIYIECKSPAIVLLANWPYTEPVQCLEAGEWSDLAYLKCKTKDKRDEEQGALAGSLFTLYLLYMAVIICVAFYFYNVCARRVKSEKARRRHIRQERLNNFVTFYLRKEYPEGERLNDPGGAIDKLVRAFLHTKMVTEINVQRYLKGSKSPEKEYHQFGSAPEERGNLFQKEQLLQQQQQSLSSPHKGKKRKKKHPVGGLQAPFASPSNISKSQPRPASGPPPPHVPGPLPILTGGGGNKSAPPK